MDIMVAFRPQPTGRERVGVLPVWEDRALTQAVDFQGFITDREDAAAEVYSLLEEGKVTAETASHLNKSLWKKLLGRGNEPEYAHGDWLTPIFRGQAVNMEKQE